MNIAVFIIVLLYLTSTTLCSIAAFMIAFPLGLLVLGLFSLVASGVLYKELTEGGE